MKILYITTQNPRAQGDFQENIVLYGLRSVLGSNVIDVPRKKVMYGDFSETSRDELHGRGFTLYTHPIEDVSDVDRSLNDKNIDVVLYGVTNAYGITDFPEINRLTNHVWYIDGHDNPDILKRPCFKREMFKNEPGVYPTGFGIPTHQIRPITFNKKNLIQSTAPAESKFEQPTYGHLRLHYSFSWNQENE